MAINKYMIPFEYRCDDNYGVPVYLPVHFCIDCFIKPNNGISFVEFEKRPFEILLYWTLETNEFMLCDAKTKTIIEDYFLGNWEWLRDAILATSSNVESE